MSYSKKLPWLIFAALILCVLPAGALAQEVNVFAEGAYSFNRGATTGKLVVYIYADINTAQALCSYGVKLNYSATRLGSPAAEKNTTVWYMGSSSPGNPYMNPDISTPGQVIFIGGKLDTANPSAGVTGPRVLLGKVSFTRLDNDNPQSDPDGPAGFFDISLGLGKAPPYDNFVTVSGVKKDAVTAFSGIVAEAGDANLNGTVESGDAQRVSQIYFGNRVWTVFADCNLDGDVNSTDAQCIRLKYFGAWY